MVAPACCFLVSPSHQHSDSESSSPPLPPMLMRGLVNRGLCRMFTLEEMKKATNNFSKDLQIGAGTFVEVFRGIVDGGATQVIIKRVIDARGSHQFRQETELLSKLRHRHLISLAGFCFEEPLSSEPEIAVYDDYMAHGSLRWHLYDYESRMESPIWNLRRSPLPWNLRLQICIGVARGLHYLHAEATDHFAIHHDISTGNIFLDLNWDAKIANLGLFNTISAKVSGPVFPNVKDTIRYVGREKSDVYSFGVVLLEVLCARPPISLLLPETEAYLPRWALHCQKNGKLEEIVDPYLQGKITPECLSVFVETAVMCLADHGMDRPTMGEVTQKLEFALHLQQITTEENVAPLTWAQNKKNNMPEIVDSCEMNLARWLPPCQDISLIDIQCATNDFHPNHCISTGGLNKIYKAHIHEATDTDVAIKLTTSPREFETEIMILSRLCHRNLIFLVGYCDNSKLILIYDYMALGNLGQHLYNSRRPTLPWKRRLRICIGVARALNYLHHEASNEVIVHRNVNTASILLDQNFVPKLSGFKQSTKGVIQDPDVMDDTEYMDPEYFHQQHLTEKSDVYSFGVVLFEVLCARPPMDISLPRERVSLSKRAIQCQQDGALEETIDPYLKGKISPRCFKVFQETATRCLANRGVDRPTIKDVLYNLEFALQLQQDFDCRLFTLSEIRKATNDFDDVLLIVKDDEFGNIYRGVIDSGITATHVAIRRANLATQVRYNELQDQIELICKRRHPHLAPLIGFYIDNSEMILIYEYRGHGNLSDHLHNSQNPPLPWKRRLEICIGAARGLHYLHVEAIPHQHVRTSSILLDYKWVSKLAQFEPLRSGLSLDRDVQSLGMVLFEILSARSLRFDWVELAKGSLRRCENGMSEEIIDSHLKGKIEPACLKKFVDIAIKCLADNVDDQPTMGEVLSNLELALNLQECPVISNQG